MEILQTQVVEKKNTFINFYPRLLRLWVRIPPGAWMFVCCECCVLSGRGLCDEPITHPEESYRLWCVVVCDPETSRMRSPWPALGRSATTKKKLLSENRAFKLIMGTNFVQPGRPQMTIWRMRVACWITKATNTHSEYIILTTYQCNNGYTNAPQYYVARTLRDLLFVTPVHVARSAIRSIFLITVTPFNEKRYKVPHFSVFANFVLV